MTGQETMDIIVAMGTEKLADYSHMFIHTPSPWPRPLT